MKLSTGTGDKNGNFPLKNAHWGKGEASCPFCLEWQHGWPPGKNPGKHEKTAGAEKAFLPGG